MKNVSQGTVEAIPFPTSLHREDWTAAVRILDERLAMVRNMKNAASLWADDIGPIIPAVLYETFQRPGASGSISRDFRVPSSNGPRRR
jgi:hypothetical protein